MKDCTYLYKGVKYNTYQDLVNYLTDDDNAGDAYDLLFSLADPKKVVVDKLNEVRREARFDRGNMHLIDGSPDVAVTGDMFTTQTFIDSAYFKIDGESPMFQLSNEDYINQMKKKFSEDGTMTAEQAEQWGKNMVARWETIAENASKFHELALSDYQQSFHEWSLKTANTAFENMTQKIIDAEDAIFTQAIMRNGHDHLGNNTKGDVLKNFNFVADLKGHDEKIMGHIDYLIVKPNGDIEIYNIKTSTEPFGSWSTVKKEKYRYQLALLKQMLAFHGIDPRRIRVNIIPVRLQYNESLDTVTDIDVHNAVPMDFYDTRYTFTKYDNAAEAFIDSTADFNAATDDTLIEATNTLQKIFPSKGIGAEAITLTAKEWIDANWRYMKPKVTPDGMEVTIPGSNGTQEVIKLKNKRRGSDNDELISVITSRMDKLSSAYVGQMSAANLYDDLTKAFEVGCFDGRMSGEILNFVKTQFYKYLDDREEISTDDSGRKIYKYRWEIIDSPALRAANIIAFRHRDTGQLDVFTLTSSSPATKCPFKGRKNLLGFYLTDTNSENFIMESNCGNIDAIRTLAVLNEVLPKVQGKVRLGTLQIVGLTNYNTKKGALFEFDTLLRQWDTIVRVVNRNNPGKGISNNFRSEDIRCISPDEAFRQVWNDICEIYPNIDSADLRGLSNLVGRGALENASTVDGLVDLQTVEGKMEKLRQIIEALQGIARSKGLNYADPKVLADASHSADTTVANIAKVYIAASRALSLYYGDISQDNERFTELEEVGIRPESIANSNMRRASELIRKSITNIRNTVSNEYMSGAAQIFKEYYEKCGYGTARNMTIGDQARMYNNLYERDENGQNTFLFKNPYDNSNDLKDHERMFLKKILFEFYKVRCNMDPSLKRYTSYNDQELIDNLPNNYLFVPLQRAANATRRLNIGNTFKQMYQSARRIFSDPKGFLEERAGYLSKQDVDARDREKAVMRVYNPYTRGEINLYERGKMIDEKGVGYYETNLENIFVDFMFQEAQCREFNKLMIRIKGIELSLVLKGIAEGDTKEIDHTIKTISDYVDVNVFNRSIMSETGKTIEAFLKPLRGLVSRMYIACNVVGCVRDTLQGFENNFLHAAIKYQTDVNMSDVAFGSAMIFKDCFKNLNYMSLLNQFNIKYGFSNFDAAQVAERLKSGRGGILNADNWGYWTLRAPDYLNRMTLFLAKLHHDGAFDAYALDKDHRLKYDWKKDKRFEAYANNKTEDPKYNEQRAFYYSMIRAFNEENPELHLSYTDDLPDAYTNGQIQAIKTLGETIYGSYDKSSKAKYENLAIGRNFMFFTTWMNGMVDTYWKRRQISSSELKLEQETDYNGNKLFFTSDGSGNTTTEDTGMPVYKYVPIMVQGVFQTIGELGREVINSGWNFKKFKNSEAWTSEMNRRNLKKLISDMLIASILYTMFKLWLTPAYNKHKAEDDGREFFSNAVTELLYKSSYASWDTFKGPLNVVTYLGENTNPATYTISATMAKNAYGLLFGNKNFYQAVAAPQAFFRGMQDSYRMYMRDSQ